MSNECQCNLCAALKEQVTITKQHAFSLRELVKYFRSMIEKRAIEIESELGPCRFCGGTPKIQDFFHQDDKKFYRIVPCCENTHFPAMYDSEEAALAVLRKGHATLTVGYCDELLEDLEEGE